MGEVRKPEDDPGGFSYAKRVLDRFGHDIVVRTIVGQYGTDLERPVVISGLRDVEEVRYMRGALRDAVLVLVEAPERTRFDRHIRRARPGAETRLVDFRKRDRF